MPNAESVAKEEKVMVDGHYTQMCPFSSLPLPLLLAVFL